MDLKEKLFPTFEVLQKAQLRLNCVKISPFSFLTLLNTAGKIMRYNSVITDNKFLIP